MTTQPLPPTDPRSAALAQLATEAWTAATAATDIMCGELDRLIGRLTRKDSVFQLTEYGTGWTVIDSANESVPMFPPTSFDTAYNFLVAVVAKNPGASIDTASVGRARYADLFAVRVPDVALSERDQREEECAEARLVQTVSEPMGSLAPVTPDALLSPRSESVPSPVETLAEIIPIGGRPA